MAEQAGRFGWVVRLAHVALVASLVVLSLGSLAIAAALVLVLMELPLWASVLGMGQLPLAVFAVWFVVICVLGLLAMGVAGLWLLALYGTIRAKVSTEEWTHAAAVRLRSIETLIENQSTSLEHQADLAQLSDQAKSLIYRDREVEAFRETVQSDLMKEQYEAAEGLIDAFEKRFGLTEEASRMRQEVAALRKASLEEKVDQAIRRIWEIAERKDWPRARRAAQRLGQVFPEHPKVQVLPERIEEAVNDTKRDLLQPYSEEVDMIDFDGGVRLLKELDRYLTPKEAAALAESARGVFRAKLLNLGVQFAIHVADQRWDGALATGEEIMREFPNSRMAQEVREKMDLLRQRVEEADRPTASG